MSGDEFQFKHIIHRNFGAKKFEKPLTLIYWNFRGRAHFIRQLLEYLEVPYTDTRLNWKANESGEYVLPYSIEDWDSLKAELSTKCDMSANLPFLMDGTECIAQSRAVLYYIAQKYGKDITTGGKGVFQKARHINVFENIFDIFERGARLCYDFRRCSESFNDAFTLFLNSEQVIRFLNDIESVLTLKFLFDDSELSIADFVLYETLDFWRLYNTGGFRLSSRLQTFINDFEGIERISQYQNSDGYIRYNFTAPSGIHKGCAPR